MNELESQISTILHEAVPEPRREIQADDVLDTPTSRNRLRLLAPLGAVAAVLALTLAVTLPGSRSHTGSMPKPGATPTITDPTALFGVVWTLSDIHGLGGVASTKPDADTTLTFSPNTTPGWDDVVDQDRCGSASARIGTGEIVFTSRFAFPTSTLCGPRLGITQHNFVSGSVLTGTVTWEIDDGRLTITKAGVGSLDFVASPGVTTPSDSGETS